MTSRWISLPPSLIAASLVSEIIVGFMSTALIFLPNLWTDLTFRIFAEIRLQVCERGLISSPFWTSYFSEVRSCFAAGVLQQNLSNSKTSILSPPYVFTKYFTHRLFRMSKSIPLPRTVVCKELDSSQHDGLVLVATSGLQSLKSYWLDYYLLIITFRQWSATCSHHWGTHPGFEAR